MNTVATMFEGNNNALTDVIFPHQKLPLSSGYESKIDTFFDNGLNGLHHGNAFKAITVRELLLDTYGEGNYPFNEIITPSILIDEILQNRLYVFFFVVNGAAVGTASVIPDGHDGAEFGRMAIHRNYRRYGIGDLLLNARITFTSIFQKQLNIKWFYTSTRAANTRIQDIWIRSPHRLKIAGISPFYTHKNHEFYTIFMRHFEPVETVQFVECVQEAQPLISAVMKQFPKHRIEWQSGEQVDRRPLPDDYEGYFTKRYIHSVDISVKDITRFSTSYCEIVIPTNITGSKNVQRELMLQGFFPNGFYPGFNGFPPFLTFGKLHESVRVVQEVQFPDSILKEPIGGVLSFIYRKFCQGKGVAQGDPFK